MRHFASPRFWAHYRNLQSPIQRLADEKYQLLKADTRHPSLHLKRVGRFWSSRVGLYHRALGVDVEGGILWFWIGSHADYDRVGEASICVLDEKWPLTYLQVYGPARLDSNFDLVIDTMIRVGEIMSGQPPKEARPLVEEMARREDRVLIRLSPQWTVYSPPVHLNAGDDGSKMQHGLAQRLPWKV